MAGKRRSVHFGIGLGIALVSASGAAAVINSTAKVRDADEYLSSRPNRLIPNASVASVVNASYSMEPQSCPNIPSGGGEDLQTFITKSDGSCTVQNGSYVRTSTNYTLHVLAEAYGQCQWRYWSCSPAPCGCANFLAPQLRRPDGVGILLYNSHPLSPFSIGPIYPNDTSLQQWDSRVSGQTSPPGRGWNTGGTLGEATLRFTEGIVTTACNITPSQKVIDKTAYVVQCQPKFLSDNGHLEPDSIEVFLDPASMSAAEPALDLAIQDWNNNVTGTGVALARTGSDCGTGPRCIRVIVDPLLPKCGGGSYDPVDPVTGYIPGGLVLKLHSSWSTFTAASLQRTFAHELGHFLGLDDYTPATGCGVDDAVMRDDFVCGPANSPGVAVTLSDAIPVAKSTYGGGTKTTCGW